MNETTTQKCTKCKKDCEIGDFIKNSQLFRGKAPNIA